MQNVYHHSFQFCALEHWTGSPIKMPSSGAEGVSFVEFGELYMLRSPKKHIRVLQGGRDLCKRQTARASWYHATAGHDRCLTLSWQMVATACKGKAVARQCAKTSIGLPGLICLSLLRVCTQSAAIFCDVLQKWGVDLCGPSSDGTAGMLRFVVQPASVMSIMKDMGNHVPFNLLGFGFLQSVVKAETITTEITRSR